MKVIGFRDIDGYRIVTAVGEGSVNPEATKAEIAKQTGCRADAVHLLDNYSELFRTHKVLFSPGPGQLFMEDPEAEALAQAHATLGPHQCLLITGEIIPNYANTEYWKQTDGKWEKRRIERIGEAPDGIPAGSLSEEQRKEIAAQEEMTRICCMTSEKREKELQRELDALADEADRLEKRRRIQGVPFDPVAWYQEHAQAVSQKYAVGQEV